MLGPTCRERWRWRRWSHWYIRHDGVALQSENEAIQPLQEELVMGKSVLHVAIQKLVGAKQPESPTRCV
jgi:hypothetical protein